MTAELLEIVKTVGIPFFLLGVVGAWVGKALIPRLLAQHDEDRSAFLVGIQALTNQAAAERAAFQARPCYWQAPPNGPIHEVSK